MDVLVVDEPLSRSAKESNLHSVTVPCNATALQYAVQRAGDQGLVQPVRHWLGKP